MSEAKIVDFFKVEPVAVNEGVKESAVEGKPYAKSTTFYAHSSGNFRAGHWSCTAGSWEHNHPKLEFCYITKGSVKIKEMDSGIVHTYNAGDSFVVPKGLRVTWIVEEYAEKVCVTAPLEGE